MKKIVVILLIIIFVSGCLAKSHSLRPSVFKTMDVNNDFVSNYDEMMKFAEELAETLAKTSEFNSCFWVNALGSDADRVLPYEARKLLDDINKIVSKKKPKELTGCDKGKLLGMWIRFTYLVSESTINKVTPYLIKFVGAL